MAALKRKMLQLVNSLLVFLISLLGFTTSCVPMEYGTPTADFFITGDITSAKDNQPIPDIIVEMRWVRDADKEQPDSLLVDTNFSDSNGYYGVRETVTSLKDRTYQIKYTDTNGPINGEYQTLDTVVVFQDPKFTGGDGDWYLGSVFKELDVKLKPKE